MTTPLTPQELEEIRARESLIKFINYTVETSPALITKVIQWHLSEVKSQEGRLRELDARLADCKAVIHDCRSKTQRTYERCDCCCQVNHITCELLLKEIETEHTPTTPPQKGGESK